MNANSIPGFTAEASLHGGNDHYLTTSGFAQGDGIVAPAQFGEVPGLPGQPEQIPPINLPPRVFCYYPCNRICLPPFPPFYGACFYPCNPRCIVISV